MLKLRKLAICKLYLSRGGSYLVSRCVRTWIKLTPEYPFKVEFFISLFLELVAKIGVIKDYTLKIKKKKEKKEEIDE